MRIPASLLTLAMLVRRLSRPSGFRTHPFLLSIEASDSGGLGAERGQSRTGRLILGGVVGGMAGLAAGAMVGRQIGEGSCPGCWVDEMFLGAVVGGSLGVALGVHKAPEERGSLAHAAIASLVIGAGGSLAAWVTDRPALLLGIPVLQIAAAHHGRTGTTPITPPI